MPWAKKRTRLLSEHNIRQIAENLRSMSAEDILKAGVWRNSWAKMLDEAADELVELELEARTSRVISRKPKRLSKAARLQRRRDARPSAVKAASYYWGA